MSRLSYVQQKIVEKDQALRKLAAWKSQGNRVVFTNGCFDILHQGHVTYLAKAAELGDRLVVALNTDDSVRRQNKGPERPLNNEGARALLIAALGFVDLVVFFEEDTPEAMIESLQPDILVKGADYDPEEKDPKAKKFIVGSDTVRAHGGEVRVIELEQGYSTTSLVDRLKNS
ncbi:MAG: D-glycero-beta-D-manno-heptose 1-phosphate adenylyltransferase [Bacteroidetes bacterium]|nr:MAG: D-glycero-beta-D-manno-heptose 1-phosphate adenylyltransferase [Bacteroidota bacterium]